MRKEVRKKIVREKHASQSWNRDAATKLIKTSTNSLNGTQQQQKQPSAPENEGKPPPSIEHRVEIVQNRVHFAFSLYTKVYLAL